MKCVLILAPLALAACNSGPSVDATNASTKEVADKVAAAGGAQFLNPGRWEGTGGITEMEIPGMPPEQAAKMKEAIGKEQSKTFTSCLTPEEAKKPAANFFAGNEGDCRYDHFTMRNGKIDATMTCKAGGVPNISTINGSFSGDSFQMVMTSKSAGTPGQAMSGYSMKMKVDAHRTGACNGTEKS